MAEVNRQIVLKRRPEGTPTADCFEMVEGEIPVPGAGQALVRNLYLSLDPAIRGWMKDVRSYLPPIGIGEPVRSGVMMQVISSDVPGFEPGDLAQGIAAWEDFSVVDGKWGLTAKIDTSGDYPLAGQISLWGGNGLTAYFGLLDVGRPKEGETVVITAAAGGVGSLVGQIAKIKGCRVVGMTGSDEKCRWLVEELGFDAAINYKTADLRRALKEQCPEGIDIFWDSVGGPILEAGLARLAMKGRVVICGAISQINATERAPGPGNYLQLMEKRARMEGFVTMDYASRYDEARREIKRWYSEGKILHRDHCEEGLENAPAAFLRLFDGSHKGKLLVKVRDPE